MRQPKVAKKTTVVQRTGARLLHDDDWLLGSCQEPHWLGAGNTSALVVPELALLLKILQNASQLDTKCWPAAVSSPAGFTTQSAKLARYLWIALGLHAPRAST